MLFNSVQFLIFFPIVTITYFLIPFRFRWLFLLAASCLFYMAFIPAYILILFVLILIDYFMAIWIEEAPGIKKKHFLIVSIFATCIALFVFKYFNFFSANCQVLAHLIRWNYPIGALQIVLPLGLSFHTFQSLAYVIEVYRGRQKAERHLGVYALYVMFYPQLVAGPIERPGNLLHQFYQKHSVNYERIVGGLKLMVWGLFKKVVIADRLAIFVNNAYGDPGHCLGITYVMATVFFAFQIYCDFSGYTDIAIGAAKVMGFELMKNFNRPYTSRSVAEFWRRWHISLSSWFRDYIYIPLGGNRVSNYRLYFNLFITFLLSGLWHGANWTYVIWGGLNGFYLVFAYLTRDLRSLIREKVGLTRHQGLLKMWQISTTFILICLSWVFFRAKSVGEAIGVLGNIMWSIYGCLTHIGSIDFYKNIKADILLKIGPDRLYFKYVIFLIVAMLILESVLGEKSFSELCSGWRTPFRWLVYYGLFIAIIFLGVFDRSPFIYFQF